MLNTLSSILTLSNTLKVRVMKEKAAATPTEAVPVEQPIAGEEKPIAAGEKPAEEKKEEEKEEIPPENISHSVEIKLRGSVEDDVQRLSSLLSHAVTQQFNVLTRLRKFMDNAGPLASPHA